MCDLFTPKMIGVSSFQDNLLWKIPMFLNYRIMDYNKNNK